MGARVIDGLSAEFAIDLFGISDEELELAERSGRCRQHGGVRLFPVIGEAAEIVALGPEAAAGQRQDAFLGDKILIVNREIVDLDALWDEHVFVGVKELFAVGAQRLSAFEGEVMRVEGLDQHGVVFGVWMLG